MSGQAVIGVDPGAKGAIALLHRSRTNDVGAPELLDVSEIPTLTDQVGGRKVPVVDAVALTELLRHWAAKHDVSIVASVVERVAAMPSDYAPQAFSFGRSYGAVVAMLQCSMVSPVTVPVMTWRQIAGVGRVANDDNADHAKHRRTIKNACRARAVALWPERADWFKLVKDADKAEAALIALSLFIS